MSTEWHSSTLGEFVRLQRGHDLTAPEQQPGNIPIMGSAGPNGTHSIALANGPGVVVGRSGASAGRVHFSAVDYWPHNTCLYVTDFLGNSPRFAYYLLQTLDLASFNSGSAQPSLNRNFLYAIPVKIPTRIEQDGIVALLQSLDDRITLLRETNATLEAIVQALFKSWFVDFDPVRAKMEGRAPEGMDEATAALFPDALEESELGWVPKGWNTQTFRDTINIIGGGTPKTSNAAFWGGEIPWFSVVDAPNAKDVFVVDTDKHITEAGLNGSSTKLLPTGTTIISARGTVGRLALTGRPMAMNQSCYGLLGKAGDAYFTYFSTTRLVEQLKQRAHGSVFDTITQDTFSGVMVSYPTREMIAAFEVSVEPLMLRLRENLLHSGTLATLRDTLLPRLISGQLRLPEAQALVAAA
ncbi:MAG: restriction endonuclease subunit S [Xylophilus sp.]|nr:restriction endonuclease subunit S [Aquabacterium sp.]MBP7414821.1 restriction endonuclease subunit S [Giesbergeria sp.]MBP8229090.1 restriction endonuclease subunit S [Xylophilus sp.]